MVGAEAVVTRSMVGNRVGREVGSFTTEGYLSFAEEIGFQNLQLQFLPETHYKLVRREIIGLKLTVLNRKFLHNVENQSKILR